MGRAGKLRHIITLQSQGVTKPGDGTWSVAPATVTTRKARVTATRATELTIAQQQDGQLRYDVYMRYHSTIDNTWRILFDSKTLEIEGPPITLDANKRYMLLKCVEVTN